MRTKYGYTLNKRELNKWLKEYDYTYKDLAFELETDARTLRQIVYKRWALTNVKIGKLIEFLGAENAFRIINFKNKEEAKEEAKKEVEQKVEPKPEKKEEPHKAQPKEEPKPRHNLVEEVKVVEPKAEVKEEVEAKEEKLQEQLEEKQNRYEEKHFENNKTSVE